MEDTICALNLAIKKLDTEFLEALEEIVYLELEHRYGLYDLIDSFADEDE